MDPFANMAVPRWAIMWSLAMGIYGLLKIVSLWPLRGWPVDWRVRLAYLVTWPGMDAPAFCLPPSADVPRPRLCEWIFAAVKMFVGLGLILFVVPILQHYGVIVAGWTGLAGLAFVLHFGVFPLLSCFWRAMGRKAVPLMDWPIVSGSVTEFWGRRWNRAFRDLTHRFLFAPLYRRMGAGPALMTGFVASGFVHDAVISLPAGAGYGWPTAYFVLQGTACLLERRVEEFPAIRRNGRCWVILRRLIAWLIVLGPAGWLFHEPFLRTILLPFLADCVPGVEGLSL